MLLVKIALGLFAAGVAVAAFAAAMVFLRTFSPAVHQDTADEGW